MKNYFKKIFLFLAVITYFIFTDPSHSDQKMAAQDNAIPSDDFVIGVNADFSLGGASAGEAILSGVELAVQEINSGGGLLGRRIRVDARDHAGVVLRGIENLKKISENRNLIGVIGGIHSNVVLSELKYVHEKKIPYLIPWAAADELTDNGYNPNFVFRLGARDEYVAEFLVSKALLSGRRIAFLLETTVWGRSNNKALKRALNKRGMRPVAVEWIDRADNDVNIQISAIQKSGADVVIMALNAPEGVLAVNTMVNRKSMFAVLSHWGIAHKDFFQGAKDSLQRISVRFFQPFSFEQLTKGKIAPILQKLVESRFGLPVTQVNALSGIAHAYDLTRMLSHAVVKTKSTDRSLIRSALERLSGFEGASCPLDPPFTPKRHEAIDSRCFVLAKFSKNGIVTIESSNHLQK
jgi:branched-chain amino acid transport system substrate-binding protein